jgi:hypothetical protein
MERHQVCGDVPFQDVIASLLAPVRITGVTDFAAQHRFAATAYARCRERPRQGVARVSNEP